MIAGSKTGIGFGYVNRLPASESPPLTWAGSAAMLSELNFVTSNPLLCSCY